MPGLLGSAAHPDLTRVASNIGALNALNSLLLDNRELAIAQTRLATGRRLNTAEDDPAGFTIGTKMRVRATGYLQALDNIGDGKNFLATAEGSLQKLMDLLIKIRSKAQQAIGDIMGPQERNDIEAQISQFLAELDDINNETTWNGRKLLEMDERITNNPTHPRTRIMLQTGANSENTVFFGFSMSGVAGRQGHSSGDLHLAGVVERGHVDSHASAQAYMGSIESAIASVSISMREVGSMMARLTFKEEQVTVAHANVEAAFSRIYNADIAREQVKATTYLILQQIATAALAQANANPQAVLSLFR